MRATKEKTKRRQRVAIVATVRNAGPLLASFIEYHLAIGFDYLFLFFDDPLDPGVPHARRYAQVKVIVNDLDLKKRWMQTALFLNNKSVRWTVETEVMSRQMLNAEVAVGLARENEVDWLLHIDSDELFYSSAATAPEHFTELAAKGVAQVCYLNFEAVTEAAEVRDPFREVTLFKRNPRSLPGAMISKSQRKLVASVRQFPDNFFFFYSNGKSAVRLQDGVLPAGVHGFTIPKEMGWKFRLQRKISGARPVELARRAMPNLGRRIDRHLSPCRTMLSKDPVILHYPCCGFENFWNKYTTLGNFGDKWWGKADIASHIGLFHLESRDIVALGDRALAKEFYEQRFVMSDQAQILALIETGLLIRVTLPALLLAREPHGS